MIFPDLSGFRITFSGWKDGILLLRRISCRSAAPWCTEPPLGSLPRATALCSMPVTSRRGNITPRTYQWLPTQVSQSSTMWCLSQKNAASEMFISPPAFCASPFNRIWRACGIDLGSLFKFLICGCWWIKMNFFYINLTFIANKATLVKQICIEYFGVNATCIYN